MEPRHRQLELLQQVLAKSLSVRQLEELAGQWQPRVRRRRRTLDPELGAIEEQIRQLLGTKVTLTMRRRGGRIVVQFFSSEELSRILKAMGISR